MIDKAKLTEGMECLVWEPKTGIRPLLITVSRVPDNNGRLLGKVNYWAKKSPELSAHISDCYATPAELNAAIAQFAEAEHKAILALRVDELG